MVDSEGVRSHPVNGERIPNQWMHLTAILLVNPYPRDIASPLSSADWETGGGEEEPRDSCGCSYVESPVLIAFSTHSASPLGGSKTRSAAGSRYRQTMYSLMVIRYT